MTDNLVRPSNETIKFLKDGTIAFHPTAAFKIFSLAEESLEVRSSYGGFNSAEDFDALLFNLTGKDSVEDAAIIVRRWEEGGGVESNIPKGLDEKVALYEESLKKENANRQNFDQIKRAKEILLESQRYQEEKITKEGQPSEINDVKTENPKVVETKQKAATSVQVAPENNTIGFKIIQESPPNKEDLRQTAEFRRQVSFAEKELSRENPDRAVGLIFLTRGITSDRLEKSAQNLDSRTQLRVNKIIQAIKNTEYSFPAQAKLLRQTYSIQEVNLILSSSQVSQGQITAFFNSENDSFIATPNRGIVGNVFTSAGQQLWGYASNKAINKVASKVGEKIASKAAGAAVAKGTATGVGAALGTAIPIPIVGQIIGAVVGWVVSKIISKIPGLIRNIKRHAGDYGGLGVVLISSGVVLGIPVAIGAGALVTTGAVAIGGSAAFTGIGSFLGTVGSVFLFNPFVQLIKGVLFAFVGIVIAIALILFIINTGAYVIPPDPLSLGENPYISVVKTVSPDTKHENSELAAGIKVTYKIEVSAKKTSLENIRIEHKCEVISKSGTSKCNAPLPSPLPLTISIDNPSVFEYPEAYSGDKYKDSLIVNTFSVTADSTETKGVNSAGTATVIIGNPPVDCPNGSWPVAGNAGVYNVTQGSKAPLCSHQSMSADAIDIGVGVGKMLITTNSGVVTKVYDEAGGMNHCYGKHVTISSACGSSEFVAVYGHMSVISVKQGQHVNRGDVIGYSGNTAKSGCTSGPHLHFEFRKSYDNHAGVNPPQMKTPYLVRDIPPRCCNKYNGISCNN